MDVGGHRLYIECTGSGSPTVVLDAGLNSGGHDWRDVRPQISEFARVCTYDRAGVERSEPAPQPRTSQNIADDLDRLLDAAGIESPVVLVGHSFAAMNVRVYASQHPDGVAGVVLVDGLHPDAVSRLRDIIGPTLWGAIQSRILESSEGVDLSASSAQADAADLLGDIPLVVIAAGRGLVTPFAEQIPRAEELDLVWRELQRDMVTWSTRGELVVAADSGHCIHCDDPQIVVDAVRRVVEAER